MSIPITAPPPLRAGKIRAVRGGSGRVGAKFPSLVHIERFSTHTGPEYEDKTSSAKVCAALLQ